MNLEGWKRRVEELEKNIYALYLASRHPDTPLRAKLVVVVTVAYALSPIDLIPDFIPVLGYIDDLLLLPAGIWLALRLIPEPVWRECQEEAAGATSSLPQSRRAAIVIVSIWTLLLVWLVNWFLWR